MIDREQASNAPKVGAFQIETHGLLSNFFGIAVELRLWRVVAVALTALKTLASGTIMTGFNLSCCGVARGTFKHGELYTVPMLV